MQEVGFSQVGIVGPRLQRIAHQDLGNAVRIHVSGSLQDRLHPLGLRLHGLYGVAEIIGLGQFPRDPVELRRSRQIVHGPAVLLVLL